MITQLRRQLITDLAAVGVPVQDAWPGKPSVPGLIVVPAVNYVAAGQTFTEFIVSLQVLVLVTRENRDGPATLQALDSLAHKVLVRAITADWALDGIEAPSLVGVGAVQVLGTSIGLSKATQL